MSQDLGAVSRTEETDNGAGVQSRRRRMYFHIGDCLFLTTVGALATWTMHMMHELPWGFLTCALAGMGAAMLVQMLLAWCVAPLLGSIESMVPSMVVGMLSPMSICAFHLLGCDPSHECAAGIGAGLGLVMFVFIETYGSSCRKALRHTYPQR